MARDEFPESQRSIDAIKIYLLSYCSRNSVEVKLHPLKSGLEEGMG